MDTTPHTELPAFLDFCKSLDVAIVQTPEQAVEMYRTQDHDERPSTDQSDLARDLMKLREQIVDSGVRLLSEEELDADKAARRGEKSCME